MVWWLTSSFLNQSRKYYSVNAVPSKEPDKTIDDLMGIERPVRDDELAPDYDKYEDLYYDGDDDDNSGEYEKIPQIQLSTAPCLTTVLYYI